jgi:hypothetical protein
LQVKYNKPWGLNNNQRTLTIAVRRSVPVSQPVICNL